MRFSIMSGLLLMVGCSLFAFSAGYKEANDNGLVQANNRFAQKMFQVLTRDAQGDNVLFSPLSLFVCLGMIYEMSDGETERELAQVLRYNQDREDIARGYKAILSQLDGNTTSTANNLFVDKSFPVKQSFKDLVTRYFGATSENLDFKKAAERSRAYINEWVASRTNHKITNLFKQGSIDHSTAMVVVSTLYFKGAWRVGFKKSHTQKQNFYLADGTVKSVDTMTAEHSEFGYAVIRDLNGATVVSIPYKGDQQMVIIVPRERNGLQKLEELLAEKDFIADVYDKITFGFDLRVSMPKFKTEDHFNLRTPLMELGAKRMFGEGAELTRGSDDPRMAVSAVIQGTAIQVDEEGTEAAAATGGGIHLLSAAIPSTIPVHVDHPFLYVLMEGNTIAFIGQITDPTI